MMISVEKRRRNPVVVASILQGQYRKGNHYDSSDSESDNIVTERAGPRCLQTPLSDLPNMTHSRHATIILNTRKRNELPNYSLEMLLIANK